MAAREVNSSPSRAVHRDTVSLMSVYPIGTGGLPINTLGTGIATGALPIATGSVNGVPSGVPVYFRQAGSMPLTRVSAGLFQCVFAPAPNGTFRAWTELATAGPRFFQVTKRDIPTGYVQFESRSASGTLMDPANGDAIGVEYTAWTTGDAWGNGTAPQGS